MNTNTEAHETASLCGLVNFRGVTIFIYQHDGQKYIPIKIIADILGVDWRSTRKKLRTGDNKILYGAKTLATDKVTNSGTSKISNTEVFCVRLDRVELYLARINTSRVRVNHNYSAADYLLNLQEEWAGAMKNKLAIK